MSRLDKALAELAAEKPEETKPTEPKPEETQVEQPTETTEEKPEDKPEEPEQHEQPAEPTEDKPEDKGEPEPKPKKEIPDDPMKRAEYSFRRQLDKNNKKHADELAARDKEIAELKAKFAEIEKKLDPNNAPKTRKDFESDDDYIEITSGLQEGDTVAYIRTTSGSSFGAMGMMPGGMGQMGGMPGGQMGGGMPSGGGNMGGGGMRG